LIRNSVYKFNSAYVHEFSSSDKSLLLVITEHTKIDSKSIEDYREFIWNSKIESLKRPVRNLTLQGLITTVHSNSEPDDKSILPAILNLISIIMNYFGYDGLVDSTSYLHCICLWR
jgi:hypothetical protein